ncbi:hypothetical protein [Streptomyces sp. DH12]|uniref:hypothetical protein n=1 Tax=Streptomyces sp. DH12 TaxID=2857010 RepID=UPI001E530F51|nr:hypothetical protein [Streptomyces sp. DH12]
MSETQSTDTPTGRRRPPLVAVLAAVAVLAGGGGTYLAVAGGDRSEAADRMVVTHPRGPAWTPAPGASASPGTPPGVAPGERDPNDAGRYRVAGPLPDAPDRAHTYRDAGKFTEADAARLARAFGFAAKPVHAHGLWRVGPQKDGSGPELTVDDTGDYRYVAQGPRSDDCAKGKRCPGGPDDKPKSDEAAKRAVAPLLKALGHPDAALYVEGDRVVAHPRVGGLPTRWYAAEFMVDASGGVVTAEGRQATLVRGEAVPVTSAEQAVRDLGNSGHGSRGGRGGGSGAGDCASPVPHRDGGPPASVPGGPCDPRTGTPKRAQDVVTIREAVLGLAAYPVRSRAALVPAWLFTAEENGRTVRFSHPAVPLEQLNAYPPRPGMTLEGPRAGERELRVSFDGSPCSRYVVRPEESGTEVGLRLFEVPSDRGGACVSMAVPVYVTVTLDAPVGGRAVVDAESGEPLRKAAARR